MEAWPGETNGMLELIDHVSQIIRKNEMIISIRIIYLLVQLGVVHRKGHSLAFLIVELKGKNCVGFAGLFNLCLVRALW